MPKGRPKLTIAHTFAHPTDFRDFVNHRTLYHMESGKNGNDKAIDIVTSLDGAIAASKQPDTFFMLDDPATYMSDDISNLKGFRSNVAAGFEALSNRAIAVNEELAREYGGLKLLNDGRGVIFQYKSGKSFVECDGLIMNTTHVLLNEAKTRFHEDDIERFVSETTVNLQAVQLSPEKFTSIPEGIIAQLKGMQLVLVASGAVFTKEAEEACAKAGVHLLRQSGTGFVCTLARKNGAAEVCV